MKILNVLFLLLLALLISGCGGGMHQHKLEAEDLNGKGVVVARTMSTDWGFAVSRNAVISGKKYNNVILENYLILPLPAGSYSLDAIGGQIYLENMGSHTRYTYGTYPIRRNFSIKEGQVTNLGFIFGSFSSQDDYRVLNFDNSQSISAYLSKQHPQLYNALLDKKINLAPAAYSSISELQAIRKRIALQNASKIFYHDKKVINGVAGALAIVKRDQNNRIVSIRLIETNTFDEIPHCGEGKTRFACYIPSSQKDRLLVGELAGTARFRNVPKGFSGRAVLYPFGKQGIILTNYNLDLFVSHDGGRNFYHDSRFKLNRPVEYHIDIEFKSNAEGVYINVPNKNVKLYLDFKGKGQFEDVSSMKSSVEQTLILSPIK